MRPAPDIASIAALLSDRGRATVLLALVDGRNLPAGELAALGDWSASGASGHLAKLVDGGLLRCEQHGRHRYYGLASAQVAGLLEEFAVFAGRSRIDTVPPSHDLALRHARTCYDHLAGEVAVATLSALLARGWLRLDDGKRLSVTAVGAAGLGASFDIDVEGLSRGRHGRAHRCLDWTERRHHLAGPLGTRLLQSFVALGWVTRIARTRVVRITPRGRLGFKMALGIEA